MTRKFFLDNSKKYLLAHGITLTILAVAYTFSIFELSFAWLIFCIFGLIVYFKKNLARPLTIEVLAGSIPFVFSIISSVWFVSGTNNFFLLGYDKIWSFYASLHGAYLGWILIGLFVVISRVFIGPLNKIYLSCSFLFLVLFLLIAFGIDGVPIIKPIGAFGIIILTPLLIGFYNHSLFKKKGASFYLASIGLLSLLYTLYLAAANEIGFLTPLTFLNNPSMVSIHGLINGFVAIPCLFFAIYFDKRINGPY